MRIGLHVHVAGGYVKAVEHAKASGCTAMQVFSTNPRSYRTSAIDGVALERSHGCAARPGSIRARSTRRISSTSRAPIRRSPKARSGCCKTISPSPRAAGCASSTRISVRTARAIAARDSTRFAARSKRRLRRSSRVSSWCSKTRPERAILGGTLEELGALSRSLPIRSSESASIPRTRGLPATKSIPKKASIASWRRPNGRSALDRILMFHFNDTQVELGASRDRHWHIGEGKIGFEGFRALLAHRELREKTAILETPGSDADDLRNMQTILAIARGARQALSRHAQVRQAQVRLEKERRIGAVDLQPQIDVGDVGDERCGADRVAKHLKPLDGCGNLQSLYSGDSNLSTVFCR